MAWRRQRLLLVLLPLLVPSGTRAERRPELQHMYLKYKQEPVDTRPVFSPSVLRYESTLDWKMKLFSVQAKPEPPAVVDSVRLCRRDADCSVEEQHIVVIDLSSSIVVNPGGRVLFKFNVLLGGDLRTYSVIVKRLSGTETSLRGLVARGLTLWSADGTSAAGAAPAPGFSENVSRYRCFMGVAAEMAVLKLQLEDAGQMVYASAGPPVLLSPDDDIRQLRNSLPGRFQAQPARRLGSQHEPEPIEREPEGEFQYPAQYLEFPVPLLSKRKVDIKVVSADGGHYGFYSLELARDGCPAAMPIFDVAAARCVRFCNTGFFADKKATRCKRCHKSCATCLVGDSCARCPPATELEEFRVDNTTGLCAPRARAPWEQHPQRTAAAFLAASSLTIFACGLCASQCPVGSPLEGRRARSAGGGKYMRVSGVDEDER